MTLSKALPALALLGSFALAPTAEAGFDWGSDCSSGNDSFAQLIDLGDTVVVGTIPANKRNVLVELASTQDVDIQLVDVLTGTEIIAWPAGLLSGATEECVDWSGARYCYSGYNGVPGEGWGHEWIRVDGDTNRDVEVRAYGYASGEAVVDYSWSAVPTCNEVGSGSFEQSIALADTVEVGTIPAGKVNVVIDLETLGGADVDVQLWDGPDALVQWPDGVLNGPTESSTEFMGATVIYSGYNGIGGNPGHERIEVMGVVGAPLTVKAYGYQSGTATVDYRWGEGAGATCGGIAWLTCDEGLECKAMQTNVSDPAGECHTATWCFDDSTAAIDCAALPHIAIPGQWSCEEFTCAWTPTQVCPPEGDVHYIGFSTEQCAVIRFFCGEDEEAFSNACGCGCQPT